MSTDRINAQAQITSVTPQAAEMGAKVPGVPKIQAIHADGRIEWTPETEEMLRKSRAYEASVKPHASEVWRQYERGLLTFWEMVEMMTTIDASLAKWGDRRCGYAYGGYAPCQKFPEHGGKHKDANLATFSTQD